MEEAQDEFQKRFQREIAQALGQSTLDNIGQSVRIGLLGQELALAKMQLEQAQPKEESHD